MSEEFLTALHADFEENGAAVIKEVREKDPAAYLTIVASILPKDLTLRVQDAEFRDNLAAFLDGMQDITPAPSPKPRLKH